MGAIACRVTWNATRKREKSRECDFLSHQIKEFLVSGRTQDERPALYFSCLTIEAHCVCFTNVLISGWVVFWRVSSISSDSKSADVKADFTEHHEAAWHSDKSSRVDITTCLCSWFSWSFSSTCISLYSHFRQSSSRWFISRTIFSPASI